MLEVVRWCSMSWCSSWCLAMFDDFSWCCVTMSDYVVDDDWWRWQVWLKIDGCWWGSMMLKRMVGLDDGRWWCSCRCCWWWLVTMYPGGQAQLGKTNCRRVFSMWTSFWLLSWQGSQLGSMDSSNECKQKGLEMNRPSPRNNVSKAMYPERPEDKFAICK